MSLIRDPTAGMQYTDRTSGFCICAVSPVIAPQGMPEGVLLSRQSPASWRIGLSPRLRPLKWRSKAWMPQIVHPSR